MQFICDEFKQHKQVLQPDGDIMPLLAHEGRTLTSTSSTLTAGRDSNVQRSSRTEWSTSGSWTDFCQDKKKLHQIKDRKTKTRKTKQKAAITV